MLMKHCRSLCVLPCLMLSLIMTGRLAWAQEPAAPETPSIERFMKIRAPSSPTLSTTGTLYVRDWPDGVNQLYRRHAGQSIDTPMERLTDFEDGLSSFALSPNDRHIILSAASGGSEQDDLYHFNTKTDEITPLLVNPDVVYGFQRWLDDSSGFLYTANDTSAADFHLYRFDLDTQRSTKLLAEPGYWYAADVTADGSRVLVGRYFSAANAEVYELDAAGGSLTQLNIAGETAYNAPLAYMPGEHAVMIIADHEEGIRRLYVRDLTDGDVRKPLPALDPYEIEGGVINRQRTYVAVQYNEDGYGSVAAYVLPLFRPFRMPEMERGVVSDVSFQQSRLVYRLSNARSPGLSYQWTVGSAKPPTQLTEADDQGIDLSEFTLPELITYESFDELEVPAFLYLPPGHEPGQMIPFVAHYHGGPEGQFRPYFSAMTQYLLASGFGVIQPNVRGSVGYGRAYQLMDNYMKRWNSVRDGVEGARWLVHEGYAEPGRIAAFGGSYGGFMACATIIEDPTVFGASINVVGIVNFITFLEQTKDYRRALREAEYGPLSDPEFLASISPINRIDEITVPMLIAHGLNDPRVPVGEAMQLAVGLQKRGYDPELLFFPDEGHGFAKLENRLLFAKRMVRFLKEHIARPGQQR